MTVCRYFLRGTCRFGDRCRYEHVGSEDSNDSYNNSNYSNRRQDYGYQDRSRPTANYQDRSYGYQNQDLSFGPRRFDNYEDRNQNYRSNNYDDHYADGYQDYGRHSSNQRYPSPERQNFNARYDNQQNNQYNRGYYSNKHENNKYEWKSEGYKKQQKQNQPSFYQEGSLNSSLESIDSFNFKDTKVGPRKDEGNEENMILIERVKEDLTSWELGNQWPFTCYAPFLRKGEFPGFYDISFEELRYESLKAQESNSFDSFVNNVSKAILDVQTKRNKLKEPTSNVISMIAKLNAGERLTDNSVSNPFLGGFSLTNSTLDITEGMTDGDPFNNHSALSSFSFRTSLDSAAAVKNSASSFSFKTVLDSASAVKDSASAFSFKTVLDRNSHTTSTPSSFSFKDTGAISKDSNESNGIYSSIDQLSEQDKEQFYASTFTLGKIPTLPPPKVLCF